MIQRTVKVENFSMDSCEALAEFMGETDEQFRKVYGDESVLEAYGTDFKDYFLCNTKNSIVKALRESIEIIEKGLVKGGARRLRSEWYACKVYGKEKAR